MMGVQGVQLEEMVDEQSVAEASAQRIDRVDRLGNITYGLLVGGLVDFSSGLGALGIGISRSSATAMNSIVGGIYGRAREYAFRLAGVTDDSHFLYRALVELVPFNAIQVPASAAAIALGCLLTEGRVDMAKVREGAENLALLSPLVGPVMGAYMDIFRRVCGVRSAVKGAYKTDTADGSNTVVPH